MQDCVMFKAGRTATKEKLESSSQDIDSCLVYHLLQAPKCRSQIIVAIPNTTDVTVYCLSYENRCQNSWMERSMGSFWGRRKNQEYSYSRSGK